jgi:protoporphyrinogen oxidase
MMWEAAARAIRLRGGRVMMGRELHALAYDSNRKIWHVQVAAADGSCETYTATHVISSAPIGELMQKMSPRPISYLHARELRYRDFITVALIVTRPHLFPDNWIYVHDPGVGVGRIQNFGSWSPYLVKEGRTCLGLEYFVDEGDATWTSSDDALIEQGKRELHALGLVDPASVEAGYVVRMPKAYPMYDDAYKANVDTIRGWLDAEASNVHPVGRNGMHKYNNQDHSMYTAMLSVENILGASHDIWNVNVEEEYHEEKREPSVTA